MEAEQLEQLTTEDLLDAIASEDDWDIYLDWFMYKYSVMSSVNNWPILQQSAEALSSDLVFVQGVMPKLFDKIEPKFYLELLNIFACLGTTHLSILKILTPVRWF